jgi:hypothetical protein
MIERARGGNRCWSIRRATTGRAIAAHADHAESRGAARSDRHWKSEDDLRAREAARELDSTRCCSRARKRDDALPAGELHAPALAREVYDVSGAGDTVIATVATMLGAGVPLVEAVVLANRAAASWSASSARPPSTTTNCFIERSPRPDRAPRDRLVIFQAG